MIDNIQPLTIIATGSSSFDLANKTGSPLTGQSVLFHLFPFSQSEISQLETPLQTQQNLEERLIFGNYPEIFKLPTIQEKTEYLQQLVRSYLLGYILVFEGIRQSDKIIKLLRLISFQCGMEVSYNELAKQLGMSKNTVESYLNLLSKFFIIYRMGAFSTHQRKEVAKASKWFFYDNGIRNVVIHDFTLPALRKDIGQLWENYILSERIKMNSYNQRNTQYFFWRNYTQQEIDLIENYNGKITSYEFKYPKDKKVKLPSAFSTAYPGAPFEVVTKDNYLEWIKA